MAHHQKGVLQARAPTTSASVPEPEPEEETKPPVQFAETNDVHEFETDDEESDDDAPKPIKLGEDIKLDDFADDDSVATEDDLEAKLKSAEPISLNL